MFAGKVCDCRIYVERRRANPGVSYRLFRRANPSCDNETRLPGRGRILRESTPERYRKWLVNTARETLRRFDHPDKRLVFINAWNEWAEGAYLEPDQSTGYAYLQATRDAPEVVER